MQKKKSQFSSKILATSKFIPQIIGEPTICKIQIVLIAHFSKIQLFYFSSRSKKYVQFQNLFFMILHRENVLKTCHLSLDRCFLKHKKPVLKWIGVFSLTASPWNYCRFLPKNLYSQNSSLRDVPGPPSLVTLRGIACNFIQVSFITQTQCQRAPSSMESSTSKDLLLWGWEAVN